MTASATQRARRSLHEIRERKALAAAEWRDRSLRFPDFYRFSLSKRGPLFHIDSHYRQGGHCSIRLAACLSFFRVSMHPVRCFAFVCQRPSCLAPVWSHLSRSVKGPLTGRTTGIVYQGSSLITKGTPLGPYRTTRRPMPRALRLS